MATQSTPLSDYPSEMLSQIAKTLDEMYPEVVVRDQSDIKEPFEMGRDCGRHDVAQAFAIAAAKAAKKEA